MRAPIKLTLRRLPANWEQVNYGAELNLFLFRFEIDRRSGYFGIYVQVCRYWGRILIAYARVEPIQ